MPIRQFQFVQWAPVALLAVAAVQVQAHEGDAPKKHDKQAKPVIQLERHATGQTITIGPDGKIETKELDAENFQLPAEIREQLRKSMTDAMKNMGQRNFASGSITVLGPDGRVQSQTFGEKNFSPEVIAEVINKSLGMNKMPDDVKERLKNSLGTLPEKMKQTAPPQFATKSEVDALSTKLDRILERLETIERALGQQEQ